MRIRSLIACLFFIFASSYGFSSEKKEIEGTSSDFQEVFTVAGYSALIGAGVGTAALVFSTDPSENSRYVAIGASVGFVAGCLFGGYLVISPSFKDKGSSASSALDSINIKSSFFGPSSFAFEAKVDPSWNRLKSWALHFPVMNF